MTIPRFFITQKIQEDASRITLQDSSVAYQVKKVLRKKEGSEIMLLDGSGFEYLCVISSLSSVLLELEIVEKKKNTNESMRPVRLYQSIIKKDKMEWVFEKCTEIGVSEFTPILAEHSVKLKINEERSRHIIREASEQSRRGKIPVLTDTVSFSKAISEINLKENSLTIVAHNTGNYPHIKDVLVKEKNNRPVNLFIGPEGGFSESEIEVFQKQECTFVSLGVTTLRSETAAVVASLFSIT